MSSPVSPSRDREGSAASTSTQDNSQHSQILQSVANNLAQSFYTGRKRSRPQFHSIDAENHDPSAGPANPSSSYPTYGRIFQRLSSSFISIENIVIEGIRHETADSDDERVVSVASKRAIRSWNTLCDIIPNFREQMLELSADRKTRKAVCVQIGSGAKAARCDDTASLKAAIIGYLLEDSDASKKLGIERIGKKHDRGWNHPATATLLCPMKHPAMQETFTQIKNGTIPYRESALPRFLFPQDHTYNHEDIESGCFRGHLLLRVAKHILQGPSAALQAPGFHRGQQGVASLCNITSVTPPLLAYLAIQTHFALTSEATWTKRVGSFDYGEFYWNLMDILEGPEGEEITTLFNHHVFGQPAADDTVTNEDKEDSDFDIIKLQRAAKRARTASSSAGGDATPVMPPGVLNTPTITSAATGSGTHAETPAVTAAHGNVTVE